MKKTLGLSELDFIEHGFYDSLDSDLDENPILMTQVHSADAVVITSKPEFSPQADALITKTPGLNLTVKTADCAPILIADTQTHLIAAIHAGWKGAFQGIIETTLLKMIDMGGNPDYMIAGIGPHLQKQSFEINSDMYTLFPKTESHFFTPQDDSYYLFDFHAYVVHRLQRAGITHIDSILIDTYTDTDYNSYRRDPQNPARQFSSIMIKK